MITYAALEFIIFWVIILLASRWDERRDRAVKIDYYRSYREEAHHEQQAAGTR